MFWHARSTQTLSLTFFSLPLSLKISLSHVSPPLLSSDTRTAIYPWSFSLSLRLFIFQTPFVSSLFCIFNFYFPLTLFVYSWFCFVQLPATSNDLFLIPFFSCLWFSLSFHIFYFWQNLSVPPFLKDDFLGHRFPVCSPTMRLIWSYFKNPDRFPIPYKMQKTLSCTKKLSHHMFWKWRSSSQLLNDFGCFIEF